MLVNRNRNDCACELTPTIWNRNLQLCSGSNPPPSSAHHAKHAQSISPDASLCCTRSAHRRACSAQGSPHSTLPRAQTPLVSPQALLSRCLSEPCPTAGFLQLHKASTSLFLSVLLMWLILSTPPSQSFSDWSQVTPSVFVTPKSTHPA